MQSKERIDGLIELANEIGTTFAGEAEFKNLFLAQLVRALTSEGGNELLQATIISNSPDGRKMQDAHYDLLLITSTTSKQSVCLPLPLLTTDALISVLKAVAHHHFPIVKPTGGEVRLHRPMLTPERILMLLSRLTDLNGIDECDLDNLANCQQEIICMPTFKNGSIKRILAAARAQLTTAV
jgi:hypothetical protein